MVNNILKEAIAQPLFKPVSFTTRKMRRNEKQGVDYYFIGEDEFRAKIDNGELLEWIRYLDRFYGTSKGEIERIVKQGRDLILSIDVRGAFALKSVYPDDSVLIFVLPPSLAELKKRIINRGANISRAEILARLGEAKREIGFAERYDYRIENGNIDLATKQLSDIITLCRSKAGKG